MPMPPASTSALGRVTACVSRVTKETASTVNRLICVSSRMEEVVIIKLNASLSLASGDVSVKKDSWETDKFAMAQWNRS